MSEIMSMAAMDYLKQGYHLLALKGKRPHPRYHTEWSWDESIHGSPYGPAEVAALDAIFDDPTVTGIAILIPENVLVADIDTEAAAALFVELAGGVPKDTVVARTTKGLHAWYLAPGFAKSFWLGDRTLLFKGFGGYVAVWPSKHFDESGNIDGGYSWITDFSDGIDFLPSGIVQPLLDQKNLATIVAPYATETTAVWKLQLKDGKWTGWMEPEWNLSGLEMAVERAADGNQNNLIHWAACTARDDGVPFEVAMDRLTAAAIRGNHPRERAVSTIRSAYRRPRG